MKSFFEANGIDVILQGSDYVGMRPLPTASNGIQIMVSTDQMEIAQKLLEDYSK